MSQYDEDSLSDGDQTVSIRTIAHIVYGLYAASVFLFTTTFFVGAIVAYMKRTDAAGTLYASHVTWQIRTFWISFVGGLIAGVTWIIGIGFLLSAVLGLWFLYRVAKGWLLLIQDRPIADPEAWF